MSKLYLTMKQNRILLSLLILFGAVTCADAQSRNEKKYRSKAEDSYYDSLKKIWNHKDFVPVEINITKKIPYPFIKVFKQNNPAPYSNENPFVGMLDTLAGENIGDKNEFLRNNFSKIDSLMEIERNEKIGVVYKMSIIKQGRFGNRWCILYFDSKYDDFVYGGAGYWIAISDDNGKTWKQYYTGLTDGFYYSFKKNSKLELLKDAATFQIECVIIRKKEEVPHPMPPNYEIVQDSLSIEVNIGEIIKDSDNDGLTDIAESKMLLNPTNADTDGDGIIDSEDRNPRFASRNSESIKIYNAFFGNYYRSNDKGVIEIDNSNFSELEKSKSDSLTEGGMDEISLLITDDKDLQGVNPRDKTLIIMTSNEYERHKDIYPSTFIKSDFSPMFKCDKLKDTYKINTSYLTGGATYIIQKTKKGWKIFLLSSWIS
jgi:hypothetical protein